MNIFKLFFALLFFACFEIANCQERGDNLIVIHTNRSPEENFGLFGRHLISEGYSFESKDADFYTLRTNIRDCRGGGGLYNYRMNISFIESLIYVRAEWLAHTLDPRVDPKWTSWTYTNFQGSINTHVYNHFIPRLKSYNYKISYSKE